MRAEAFEDFVSGHLGAPTARSDVSYLRRVEDVLTIDLDRVDLQPDEVDRLSAMLMNAGLPTKRVKNCGSALRKYAAFVERPR